MRLLKNDRLITSIDISDGLIKTVSVSHVPGGSLLHLLDAADLPGEDKEISKKIQEIVSRQKLGKSLFYVNFPRHLVTLRNVRLPTSNADEVTNMAELQAVKYLPYSREEMVVAHKIIGVTEDGYTDILLILAQKKVIDRYLKIFSDAGISTEKIVLSAEGLSNWFSGLGIDSTDPVAIIDVDRNHTHIQIVKNGRMLFTRSISFDAAGSSGQQLLREVSLSFDSFLKEQDQRVSRIVLSGGEVHAKRISELLKENLNVRCDPVEQLRRIKIKESAGKLVSRLQEASYTFLLGAALEPDRLDVNLLPQSVIMSRREQTLKAELIRMAILVFAVLVAVFGIAYKKIGDKKRYLKEINVRLKSIEPEVKSLSKSKASMELIQDQLAFEGSAIDIIRELYTVLPEDVSLTLFEFEDNNRALLRGTAQELSRVFDLLPVLEKSQYFENVKINFANKRTFKNKEFADFEIVCPLK